jgi:hypothetical protein
MRHTLTDWHIYCNFWTIQHIKIFEQKLGEIYIVVFNTVDWFRHTLSTVVFLLSQGARFSATAQTGPGAHPASYTMGSGSFPGVKRSGCGTDHPLPSSAKVKERVELYLYSTSGPSWPVLGWALPFSFLLSKNYPEDCHMIGRNMVMIKFYSPLDHRTQGNFIHHFPEEKCLLRLGCVVHVSDV